MASSPILGLQARANQLGGYIGSPFLNGNGRLEGSVSRNGAPARAVIWIHDRRTGVLLVRTRSTADGVWLVSNLNDRPYYAVCFDPAGQFNAEVADLLSPA